MLEMKKNLLILGLVGIAATVGVAVYFANKGNPVKIGPPFFKAEIN